MAAEFAAPGCVHAERCPGCPLIGQPYAQGLAVKAQRLAAALERYPALSPERLDVAGAERSTGYRVRAKLVADAQGRLGLFAAGSHEVVDIPECQVLAPALLNVANALRALLPLEIALAGVDLRLCDRGVLACLLVEGRPDEAGLQRVRELLEARLPHLAGLAVSFRKPGAVQLLGSDLRVLSGAAAERHHLYPGAVWHYASHGAFTQVHPERAAWLHARVEAALGVSSGASVLDLYAGSGALALRLAARGLKVTAVESFAPALERLGSAATEQALGIEMHPADVEDFLGRLLAESAARARFDAVIVNPPRRGLSPNVRMRLAELGPPLIVYVSCEPETLARDLSHFDTLGYSSEQVQGLDMIPLSDSLEAIAVLRRSEPARPTVLFEDEHSLALYKLPFEATTPQGEHRWDLLTRARRTLGVPELTPVHRLDRDTSGVCWFARSPEQVAPLARALEQGDKTYLALAFGVARPKGKIARPLRDAGKAQLAVTRYQRREVIAGHSLLSLWPEQGRKHQLRRHLAAIGHPVLGDDRYGRGPANRHFEHRHGLDRMFLHCASLRVDLGRGPVEMRAELPGDLAAVLDSLRADAKTS